MSLNYSVITLFWHNLPPSSFTFLDIIQNPSLGKWPSGLSVGIETFYVSPFSVVFSHNIATSPFFTPFEIVLPNCVAKLEWQSLRPCLHHVLNDFFTYFD